MIRNLLSIAVFFAIGVSFAPSAQAQLWPGYYGRYGYDGGYGAWGAFSSAVENSTSRYIAQQDHLAGQVAAARQTAAMQSNIRNTMTTEAEMRTQNYANQRQANRDWWFQTQQQQVAQRQASASRPSVGAALAAGFETVSPNANRSHAATDVIQWLPVLCEPCFAQQRAKIEAPYRRSKEAPTAADYETMIEAAQQMKVRLGRMTADISAQDYLNAEKFLDQLAAEARGRMDRAKAAK